MNKNKPTSLQVCVSLFVGGVLGRFMVRHLSGFSFTTLPWERISRGRSSEAAKKYPNDLKSI